MQEDKRNKRKGQPKGQNYRMDKIPKGLFPKGQKKEGEEKKQLVNTS